MRMCIVGRNGASLDTSLTSDQGGRSHCQLACPCTHSRGGRLDPMWRLPSPDQQPHALLGGSGVSSCVETTPVVWTSLQLKNAHQGKSETWTRLQLQALRPQHTPNQGRECLYTWGKQLLQAGLRSPALQAPAPPLIGQWCLEQRRNPSLPLALALALAP